MTVSHQMPFAGLPSFPGLVSSLRPIRRLAAQLADEAALLRRFTYKHKNQHKGHGWWKRVVEIDRSAARALDELDAWLAGFGYSDGKDEAGLLTRESVCAALLRLPRVMLIVEKVRYPSPFVGDITGEPAPRAGEKPKLGNPLYVEA
ncbi:hypothetical protein JCM3770_006016 [Rhodotorula araucariae]